MVKNRPDDSSDSSAYRATMKAILHPQSGRLCVFLVLFIAQALLLIPATSAQEYTFRQYGPSDGLTNLGVNCLLQDHIGYLWVGTDNGLFRFDGKTFVLFAHAEGLPYVEIRNLAESPDGVLWVATQNGVARRAGRNFEPVDVGVKGIFLSLSFDTRGRLYLEQPTGILRGVPDANGKFQFSQVASGAVGGLYVHGEDVWFRNDGDLWHLNADKTERVGSVAGLPADRWGAVALDSLGNLWVRSATRLYELPHGQERFIDRSEGIPQAQVIHLFADTHGRLFVSSNSGLVMLDGPNGSSRTYIDAKHGLPADVVAPVLIDRDDSLWMGMRGGGLIRRLGHGEWTSWTRDDGLPNDSVWSVLHDRTGRLWVGTSAGLSIYPPDGSLPRTYTNKSGLTGDSVFALAAAPSGDVFAGTAPAGITRFNANGSLLRTYGASAGLVAEQVNSLLFDRENRMWVTTSNGCFRTSSSVEAASLKFERVDIPGIPATAYFHDAQMDEDGIVWITTSAGLLRFDGSQWRLFTSRDGLLSSDLSGMIVGRGEVWVAYRDAIGMARLRFAGAKPEVTNVTQRDGLSSDLIYAMVFDRTGRLWASTDNGVDVLEPESQPGQSAASQAASGRWRHYGIEDGLIWDDGDDLAISSDPQGNVWIGTSRGLSRYSELSYPIPEPPSSIVITSIQGLSQDSHIREFEVTDQPILTHAQNSLVIQFSGLDFASAAGTRYRYRLLGYKDAWNETRESSVHFEGLPGGSYIFEVVAAGPNGLWSPVPARFVFKVRPPWWLSWWLISAAVIVVSLVIRALWRYRVRALLAQREFLEQQVKDRTAELRESHRQLEEIAYYDVLTSLPNRRMFTAQLRSRLALSHRHGDPFGLLFVDLDSFKEINDSFGHDAGDAVLVQSAQFLKTAVRESDCVARLGGDEFAILLISPTDPAGIEMVCARIVRSFEAGIAFNNAMLKTSCSVGVAVFPRDGDTQDRLYKSADIALYEAKRMGGSTSCRYRPELANGSSTVSAESRESEQLGESPDAV
jgi:diguanylate cyclase (GGDEF)-like protein